MLNPNAIGLNIYRYRYIKHFKPFFTTNILRVFSAALIVKRGTAYLIVDWLVIQIERVRLVIAWRQSQVSPAPSGCHRKTARPAWFFSAANICGARPWTGLVTMWLSTCTQQDGSSYWICAAVSSVSKCLMCVKCVKSVQVWQRWF